MFLLDTDFLYAYFFEGQSTHKKALDIMKKIEEAELYVSHLVLQELATVLSNKESQAKAKIAIKKCKLLDLNIITMNHAQESEAWKVFDSITNDKTSFIDCSNLYLATKFKYKIASFDKFYPDEFKVII